MQSLSLTIAFTSIVVSLVAIEDRRPYSVSDRVFERVHIQSASAQTLAIVLFAMVVGFGASQALYYVVH